MKQMCLDIERLTVLDDLPDDHPQRQHVDECPRCSALLVSYKEFVDAKPVAGSNPEDADARLSEFIENEILESPRARVSESDHAGFFRGLWATLAQRPAWAVAATAAVLALVVWSPWQTPERVLRGTEGGLVYTPLEPLAPQTNNGVIHLRWFAQRNAEAYEIRLFASDLNEVARSEILTDTTWVFDPSALSVPLASGATLFWRVIALESGDEIGVSSPSTLVVP